MRILTSILTCIFLVYSPDPDFFDENGEFLSDTGSAVIIDLEDESLAHSGNLFITTPAGFGTITYNYLYSGRAVLAQNHENLNYCDESLRVNNEFEGKIALIRRQRLCYFSDKALWAQQNGAIAVIIYDLTSAEPVNFVAQDQHNHGSINIPVMLVAGTGAQKLEMLARREGSVPVRMLFNVARTDGRVDIVLWTNSWQTEADEIIVNMASVSESMIEAGLLNMQLKNRITTYDFFNDATGVFAATNCLNNRRYCQAGEMSAFGIEAGGQDRLLEEGRQWCVNEYGQEGGLDEKLYAYEYLVGFIQTCRFLNVANWEACSMTVMNQISDEMSQYVLSCMGQAEIGVDVDVEHPVFEAMIRERLAHLVYYTYTVTWPPDVVVNGEYIHNTVYDCNTITPDGSIAAHGTDYCWFFHLICEHYAPGSEPDICYNDDGCGAGEFKNPENPTECGAQFADARPREECDYTTWSESGYSPCNPWDDCPDGAEIVAGSGSTTSNRNCMGPDGLPVDACTYYRYREENDGRTLCYHACLSRATSARYGICPFGTVKQLLDLTEGKCKHEGYEFEMGDTVVPRAAAQCSGWTATFDIFSDDYVPLTTTTTTRAPDPPGCYEVEILYRTSVYAYENRWSIIDGLCDSEVVFGSQWTMTDSTTYRDRCCLPHPFNHVLSCYDIYGDGWHGAYLYINGQRYCDSFDTPIGQGFLEQHVFAVPSEVPQCDVDFTEIEVRTSGWETDVMSWRISDRATNAIMCSSENKEYLDMHTFGVELCCLPHGEWLLTCTNSLGGGWPDIPDAEGPSITINGQVYCDDFDNGTDMEHSIIIEDNEETCADDEYEVFVYLSTANHPQEMTWHVETISGERIESCKRDESYANTNYNYEAETCCLPRGDYIMSCNDHWGDGWCEANGDCGFLVVNGEEKCRDQDSWGDGYTSRNSFSVPSATHSCTSGQNPMSVIVVTRENAGQSSFYLAPGCENAPGDLDDKSVAEYNCCLDDGAYLLECNDEYGNGWDGGYVLINNQQFCEDFTEVTGSMPGRLYTEPVYVGMGTCNYRSVAVQLTTEAWSTEISWELTNQDDPSFFCNSDDMDLQDHTTHGYVLCCLSEGTYTLNCADSAEDGWHGAFVEIDGHRYCDEFAKGGNLTASVPIPWHDSSCVNVVVRLDTQDYGEEVSWMINEGGQCAGYGNGDDGFENWSVYESACCLSPGTIEIICMDSYGDGWRREEDLGSTLTVQGTKLCGTGEFDNGFRKVVYACLSEDGELTEGICEDSGRFSCDAMSVTANQCGSDERLATGNEARRCAETLCGSTGLWNVYQLEGDDFFHGQGYGCLVSASESAATDTVCVANDDTMNLIPIDILTYTSGNGNGMEWTLENGLCSGGGDFDDDGGYRHVTCMLSYGRYTLECRSWDGARIGGNGWSAGSFVEIDHRRYCEDFTMGSTKIETVYLSEDECTLYEWTMTTDNIWSSEVSWEIVGVPSCVGGSFQDGVHETGRCCVPDGTYTLRCMDSASDGWGNAFLTMNSEQYCKDFDDSHVQQHQITFGNSGDCPSTGGQTRNLVTITLTTLDWGNEIAWMIEGAECGGSIYNNHESIDTVCCLPDGPYTLQCIDHYGDGWHGAYITLAGQKFCEEFVTETAAQDSFLMEVSFQLPIGSGTTTTSSGALTTASGCVNVAVEIHTMDFGNEFEWSIGNGECRGGPYHNWRVYEETCCLPPGEHTLNCLDTYGDGYHGGYIRVDTIMYCEDFETGFEMNVPFTVGNAPITTTASANGCITVDIGFRSFQWANEALWVIEPIDGGTSGCQGEGFADNYVHTSTCCLVPGEYTLECRDSHGDGWHDGYINIAGVYYCNDFQTGSSVIRTFTIYDVHTETRTVAPDSFQYFEEYSICTQDNMLTQEQCRTIASEDNAYLSVETVDNWPPGCYRSPNGYMWYNTHTESTRNCHIAQYCYCEGQMTFAPTTTTIPLSSFSHFNSDSFNCMLPLTYHQCVAISTTENNVITLNAHDVPSGCYVQDSRYYFNNFLTNVRCDAVDGGCFCAGDGPSTPPGQRIIEDGMCDMVLSGIECAERAAEYNAEFMEEEVQGWPYGCYSYYSLTTETTIYYFNSQPTDVGCEMEPVIECYCHSFTATPGELSNRCDAANNGVCEEPFWCESGTDCTDCGYDECIIGSTVNPVDFTYVTIEEGVCGTALDKMNILSLSQCQQIADSLDIAQTSDPLLPFGCFQQNGFYYYNFNDGAFGGCSSSRPCFCRSSVATTQVPGFTQRTEDQCANLATLEQCQMLAAQSDAVLNTEQTPDYPPGCYIFSWRMGEAETWWFNYRFDSETDCRDAYICQCAETSQQPTGVEVRLSNSFYGILEARVDGGRWGLVCNNNFFDNDAAGLAVCQQLFPDEQLVQADIHSRQADGSVTGNTYFALSDVRCPANSHSLGECQYTSDVPSNQCWPWQSVWIQCHQDVTVGIYLDRNSADDAAGVLMAQVRDNKAQVTYPSGYVCDDRFDMDANAARVACAELGYGGGQIQVSSINHPQPGVEVVLDNVRCLGSEERISDCTFSLDSSHCGSWEVIYLDCAYQRPFQIDVRLTEGVGTGAGTHGVLEAKVGNGPWGTVCDDHSSSYSYQYNGNVATVVCRQLRYSGYLSYNNQAINERAYVLDNIQCNGDENSLVDCMYTQNHNCLSGEGIYIECDTAPTTTISAVPENSFEVTIDANGAPDPQTFIDKPELRDFVTSTFAMTTHMDASQVVMVAPFDDRLTRRALSDILMKLQVTPTNSDDAIAFSNKVNDPNWLFEFQQTLTTSDQFQGLKLTIEGNAGPPFGMNGQTGKERHPCKVQNGGEMLKGDYLVGAGFPGMTKEDNYLNCMFRCIAYADCVGWEYRTGNVNLDCTLFSKVTGTSPDSSVQQKGLCEVVGIPTSMPTLDTSSDSEANTLSNDDDEKSRRGVVIILSLIIILIVIGIMVYCAYNYGKNKRLEAHQIRQLQQIDDFELRGAAPVQYTSRHPHSRPVIQQEVIYDSVAMQTGTPSSIPQYDDAIAMQLGSPLTISSIASQTGTIPRAGGGAAEGPRFTTGLEYLAAQPPIPVVTEVVIPSPRAVSGTTDTPSELSRPSGTLPDYKDVETIQ